jgi:hypothetical protein
MDEPGDTLRFSRRLRKMAVCPRIRYAGTPRAGITRFNKWVLGL